MNINENNTSFILIMDKTNFICSYNDNGDLVLKFYIFKYELEQQKKNNKIQKLKKIKKT